MMHTLIWQVGSLQKSEGCYNGRLGFRFSCDMFLRHFFICWTIVRVS
jgi:hypothetical protein